MNRQIVEELTERYGATFKQIEASTLSSIGFSEGVDVNNGQIPFSILWSKDEAMCFCANIMSVYYDSYSYGKDATWCDNQILIWLEGYLKTGLISKKKKIFMWESELTCIQSIGGEIRCKSNNKIEL